MVDPIQTNSILDDRYKINDVLGEGGMAKVYRAHDLITDRDVAIKMMKPDIAQDKVALSRFDREARAAASLNHKNIVKVLNVGDADGIPYLVNEFVDGKNLREVLDVRGNFSFLEACDIMYQLCSAVIYAHDHGVIHRDIKPMNVFLTQDGTIKLGDFGIAVFSDTAHITRSEVFVGSVHYSAPELANGVSASFRSDIYSMGITFFELITGRIPFDGESSIAVALAHVKEKFPSIKKFNPKTPEIIEKIIYKACEKKPEKRYPDAKSMRDDIEKILKNPSLLEKKTSFFHKLFHPYSADTQIEKAEKKHKKMLKEAAKQAEKENTDGR